METYKQHIVIKLDMNNVAKSYLAWTIILSVSFIIINIFLHKKFEYTFSFSSILLDITLFSIGYILLIVLHEAFHLLGFIFFGKAKFKDLKYGINLKLGVAYATTSKPLLNKHMKKALLLPFWTTGAIPTVIGFILGSNLIVLLGAWLIAGAIGDFYMYKELKKYPNNVLVKDDPKLPILHVYINNENSN